MGVPLKRGALVADRRGSYDTSQRGMLHMSLESRELGTGTSRLSASAGLADEPRLDCRPLTVQVLALYAIR